MIFVILTVGGLEEVLAAGTADTIWLNKDVIADKQLAELRAAGLAVTVFAWDIAAPGGGIDESAIDTVQEHHPEKAIWIERASNIGEGAQS